MENQNKKITNMNKELNKLSIKETQKNADKSNEYKNLDDQIHNIINDLLLANKAPEDAKKFITRLSYKPSAKYPFLRMPKNMFRVIYSNWRVFTGVKMSMIMYIIDRCVSFNRFVTYYHKKQIRDDLGLSIKVFSQNIKWFKDKNIIRIISWQDKDILVFNPYMDTWNVDLSDHVTLDKDNLLNGYIKQWEDGKTNKDVKDVKQDDIKPYIKPYIEDKEITDEDLLKQIAEL